MKVAGKTYKKSDMKTEQYTALLKPGERFYDRHTNLTLLEIKDALNVCDYGRLPDVTWNTIKHNHATNYATIWQLTERLFNSTERPIGLDKPPVSFLKWIYQNLSDARPLKKSND